MEYYYLGSLLPRLGAQDFSDEKNILKIKDQIYSLLEEEDQKQFAYLLLKNDNKNLLHLLRKKENITGELVYISFHKPSFYTYQELLDGVEGRFPLHSYMKIFLRNLNSSEEVSAAENKLLELYFHEAIETCGEFLSDYFQFKRSIKNIITTLNCKKFKYPLKENLLGKGKLVDAILSPASAENSEMKRFLQLMEDLSKTIDIGDFYLLETKIDKIYLEYLDFSTPLNPFSSEAIFAYFIRLMLGSRWIDLDEKSGKEELYRQLNWVIHTANISADFGGNYDKR